MTTNYKPHGPIPPLAPIEATKEQWEEARKICADRANAKGQHDLADAYTSGSQDMGWAMRHEMKGMGL